MAKCHNRKAAIDFERNLKREVALAAGFKTQPSRPTNMSLE